MTRWTVDSLKGLVESGDTDAMQSLCDQLNRDHNRTEGLLAIAAGLKSDKGENPEYDRALVELCTEATGLPMAEAPTVAKQIGVSWKRASVNRVEAFEAMRHALARAVDHFIMGEGHFVIDGKIGQSSDWKEALDEARTAILLADKENNP